MQAYVYSRKKGAWGFGAVSWAEADHTYEIVVGGGWLYLDDSRLCCCSSLVLAISAHCRATVLGLVELLVVVLVVAIGLVIVEDQLRHTHSIQVKSN